MAIIAGIHGNSSRLEVERQLEISRENTSCLRPTCLAGNLIPRTSSFKYLGSTKQATGGCEVDIDNVIISAWNYSGGICEKKVPFRLNN